MGEPQARSLPFLRASVPAIAVNAHSWANPIGNMLTRNDNSGNVAYSYNDAAHKHAVTHWVRNTFVTMRTGI